MEIITALDLPEKLNTEGVVVLDVFATWCGPCKVMEKQLNLIKMDEFPLSIYKLDADEETNLPFIQKEKITGIPTLLFYVNGELKDRITGELPGIHVKRKIREVYTGSPDRVDTISE